MANYYFDVRTSYQVPNLSVRVTPSVKCSVTDHDSSTHVVISTGLKILNSQGQTFYYKLDFSPGIIIRNGNTVISSSAGKTTNSGWGHHSTRYTTETFVLTGNAAQFDITKTHTNQTITLLWQGAMDLSLSSTSSHSDQETRGGLTPSSSSQTITFTIGPKTSYTVSYAANGGSTTPATGTKWYNENLTLAGAINRAGYTFKQWKATNGTLYNAGSLYSTNAATTMTAQWTVNTYKISYYKNDGTTETITQDYIYDSIAYYKDDTIFTRFGIAENTGAKTEYVLNAWGTESSGGDTITPSSQIDHITADQSLYAQWIEQYFYPLISNDQCYRVATPLSTDDSDDGEYLRISFDWVQCSNDAGESYHNPYCKIIVNGNIVSDAQVNANPYVYVTNGTYSSDVTHYVTVELYDHDRITSTVTKSYTLATAILPIDLKVKQGTQQGEADEVYMGIMHPAIIGQELTVPNEFYISDKLIFDILYPIGSYYETSLPTTPISGHSFDDDNLTDAEIADCGTSWFDPRVVLGGTWTSETTKDVYVVDEGTVSDWTYKKWSDGTAECWKLWSSSSFSPSTAVGGLYGRVLPSSGYTAFPSGLFISTPIVNFTLDSWGTGYFWASARQVTVDGVKMTLFRNDNAASAATGSFHVIGNWKTYTAPATKYKWHRTA